MGYASQQRIIMCSVPSQRQQTPQSLCESVQPHLAMNQTAGIPQQYVPGQKSPTNTLSTATTSMTDPGASSVVPNSNLDIAYSTYQAELHKTFKSVHDGRLAEAGRTVVNISDWLLSHVEGLGASPVAVSDGKCIATEIDNRIGIAQDDENMHAQRLKMWNEFNKCWLSVLQKQKEMTGEMLNTGRQPEQPQSLMDYDFMESMGNVLVKQCDMIEKHGLVDYEMGVWEEEIITRMLGFHPCLFDIIMLTRSSSHFLSRPARRFKGKPSNNQQSCKRPPIVNEKCQNLHHNWSGIINWRSFQWHRMFKFFNTRSPYLFGNYQPFGNLEFKIDMTVYPVEDRVLQLQKKNRSRVIEALQAMQK